MVRAGLACAAALALIIAAAKAGPLPVVIAVAGLFVAGLTIYPRIRQALAADHQSRQAIRAHADQQNNWAARGDLRGVYGTEGAEVMRSLSPDRRVTPPGAGAPVATVVHTDAELKTLVQEKLPCWRYAAFVSILVQRRAAVQSRLRDARTGFAIPSGRAIGTDAEAGLFFTEQLTELSDDIEQIDDFMLSPAFQSVFGDPHDENSADADGIAHAAHRLMDYHERLLTLSERCRSIGVPNDCRDLQRDVARLTLLPLEGFETFIQTFIVRVDEMADVARYATGDMQLDPVELGVEDDDDLMARVFARLREISDDS